MLEPLGPSCSPESATSGKRRPIPPVPVAQRLATGILSPRHRMPTDLRLARSPRKPTGGASNGASRPGADHPIYITARPARRSPLRKGIERRILRLLRAVHRKAHSVPITQ